MPTFYEVLTAAIDDMVTHGFDSDERVQYWQTQLKEAADRTMRSTAQLDDMMRAAMQSIYRRMVERYGVLKFHPTLQRWNIDKIKPSLHAELQRRIAVSANLIKLNRTESIAALDRRFVGWAGSIPLGGTTEADRAKVKATVKKSFQSLPFEVRRVTIDQGHKLVSSISNIVATDNGAIAAIWHSHWRQTGYNYDPDHKERDLKVYAIRGNWAMERGLMKAGPAGFYEDITAAGERVFCRCYVTYVYALGRLPSDMLTIKGAKELDEIKSRLN